SFQVVLSYDQGYTEMLSRGMMCDQGCHPGSWLEQKEAGVMVRIRLSVLFLLAVLLGFALLGFVQRADAQVLFGSVSGTITDQSGAGVPKAHVTLINKATGVQKEADTDESA